jgi:hypothetical protein
VKNNFTISTFLVIIYCSFCPILAFGQKDSTLKQDTIKHEIQSNGTRIFSKSIKTVKATIKDLPLSYPVIKLNGEKSIEVSFDELSAESHTFNYKLLHCDANWQPSKLMSIEYIKGFEIVPITTWQASQNTSIDYVHYSFSFPNDEITVLKSGNYLVQVFSDSNAIKPVFETRTVIVEDIVNIRAKAQKSSFVDNMDLMQEITIDLNLNNLSVRDPYQDIKVVICQNGRWDNANKDMQPTFVNNNELSYPRDGSNLFEGGNEFRRFNTKTTKYITEHVKSFAFNGRNFVYTLLPDEPRRYKEYEKNGDMNGNFYIINDLGQENDAITSDYSEVKFELKYESPEPNGSVYIFGAITNWEANDDSKMTYDSLKQAYTKTLFLKQGMYDYQYAYVDNDTKKIDCSYEENTHQETENEYHIFVYHKDFKNNYDTVVGYSFTTR